MQDFFPKVYLQIPHYNNAQYLEECIDSCNKLNYPNLDIHLHDDASTDDTSDIIGNMNLGHVHYHRNDYRLGRVGNYQNCFTKHGDAEWMVNLDSDDYYTEYDWIQQSMQIVIENPNDNILHIQSNFLQNIPKDKIRFLKEYQNGYYLITGIDYVKLCIQYYSFTHLSSIFKIKEIEKTGVYTDDCMHTDFLTAAHAAIKGNVLVGSGKIGCWREHEFNQSYTRYGKEEYRKNELAYYRFFEWSENYLSLKQCKKMVEIFEQREFDRKLVSALQKQNYPSVFKLLREEDKPFKKFIYTTSTILFSEKIKHISSGLITRILSVLITLFTVPLIIQYLGIENYGWIGIFTTIASAIYIFDFGLTGLITKEISQSANDSKRHRQTIIGTQETIYHIIGLFILFLIFFGSHWIAKYWIVNDSFALGEREKLIKLIALAIYTQWPHSFYSGVLFGLNKQTQANISQLGIAIFKNLGIIIILHYISANIYIFFYWQILISILTILVQKGLIYREIKTWNSWKYFSPLYLHSIKKLAIGVSLITVFGFIYGDLNNILLSNWLSLKEFGYYNILFNIILAMMMYSATVKNALFPFISKTVKIEGKEKSASDFMKYSLLISYTLIPASTLVTINSYDIIRLWIQNRHIAMNIHQSMIWVLLGSLSNAMMIIPWSFLIAMNRLKFLIKLAGFLALISMPILYYLVMSKQLLGACIYWFIINFIPMILIHLHFDRLYPNIILEKWKSVFLRPIIFSLIVFVILNQILPLFSNEPLVHIYISFVVLIIFYFIAFLAFFKKKKETNASLVVDG